MKNYTTLENDHDSSMCEAPAEGFVEAFGGWGGEGGIPTWCFGNDSCLWWLCYFCLHDFLSLPFKVF